jgi:hypothetical protein
MERLRRSELVDSANVEYLVSASRTVAGVKCAEVDESEVLYAGIPSRAKSALFRLLSKSVCARGHFSSLDNP